MSPRSEYLRLCRLLDESLHRCSDLASDSSTEDIEKDLLIALSQVFRQVKQLTDEFDSDEELVAEPVDDGECSINATVYLDNRHCLAKIIGDLMFLLAVNSQYAQHIVGNTLVAFSEFLIISFLCSLVNRSSFLGEGVGFSPPICRIIDLVPNLMVWCHADLQSPHHVRISHYFRHKVLMLMVKLTSMSHIEQTIIMTWMHLIHKYFEDLLLQPISGGKFYQDDFLEGSPFCTSIFNPGKQNMSSRHLQRLAIFLFLKCSLNLVSMRGSPDESQRRYENLKHYSSVILSLDSEYCRNSIGLIEIHEWLQSQVPADILLNDELYFERCIKFTLSFLQLFMHEDDILFDMLLQLFHLPFYLERKVIKDKPLAEVKNYPVFLASDLFNPIHLFHLFLAEIHYDHQVLLDYLISKDSGSSCAEYLLRSLRLVCNSWSLFVGFPGVEEDLGQLCAKRQKVLEDCTDFKGVLYPVSLKDGGISSQGHAHVSQSSRNYRLPFVAARDCLVSLTTSIDSLNQKKLFPYNPEVLLRRLMRFQELCINR